DERGGKRVTSLAPGAPLPLHLWTRVGGDLRLDRTPPRAEPGEEGGQGSGQSAAARAIQVADCSWVLANATVLRKPEGRKAGLGEALSVGSRNLQDQRRSQPLTWTYDPWLCPQPARRVPQDGLLPQAQTTLHELPSAQRPAPLPGSPPGSAAELQLSLEQRPDSCDQRLQRGRLAEQRALRTERKHQNQLLAKGLLFVEEKIKLCEGANRIEVLAEVWDHFFTETLPTLQAIFYPVQGQELTIRQISLLGFRDLVLLKVKLDDLLLLAQPQPPSSIIQMLLILQMRTLKPRKCMCLPEAPQHKSVHEPTGPTEGYLQLEELVKQVVSPFLGISEDRGISGPVYTLARRHSRVRPKVTLLNYAAPVSRPLNEMALTPLTEQEGEAYLEKCGSIRRHTVANAHSDIQLLAMATMMHSGLGEEAGSEDKCLLLPPSFPPPHRQCSSEPNITDSPDEPEQVAAGSQEDSELNCASLS
uniref:Proline rich 5 like n=1 Tax=Sus scrofa TaxID=9823 RepID=A0A8D1UST0_PIG